MPLKIEYDPDAERLVIEGVQNDIMQHYLRAYSLQTGEPTGWFRERVVPPGVVRIERMPTDLEAAVNRWLKRQEKAQQQLDFTQSDFGDFDIPDPTEP